MADRVVNDQQQIWYESENEVTKIGFTEEFIKQMEECWNILPANNNKAKTADPLLCVETNDGLINIFSPCTGDIIDFNDKARNFPEQLKADDVVITIGKKPKVKKVTALAGHEPVEWNRFNFEQFIETPPTTPVRTGWTSTATEAQIQAAQDRMRLGQAQLQREIELRSSFNNLTRTNAHRPAPLQRVPEFQPFMPSQPVAPTRPRTRTR